MRLLEGGLHWPYLLDVAARHRLLPLLGECLSAVGAGMVPRARRMALEGLLESVQRRNRQFALELVTVHDRARTAGIPLLSYKGPVLAATFYGDLGLRQFGDLDILADGSSFSGAETFLAASGYRRVKNFGWEVTLVNETTTIRIDLHRALSPDNFPVPMNFARLWARRVVVPLEGGSVETLSPTDLMIALCVDVVKDARGGDIRLGKMSDLAHVARSLRTDDWTRVEAEARRLGIRRAFGFAINLASNVLATSISAPAGLSAVPPRLGAYLQEAQTVPFDSGNDPRPTLNYGDRFHFHLRERWRDKLRPYARWIRRVVTPNEVDRDVLALPTWLSFVYYLIRPVRLARRYGLRRTRRILKSWVV